MNQYYINNKLQLNVMKTNVMIVSKNKEEKKNEIEIDGNVIKHSKVIKILGTKINDSLDWNTHINVGRDSLIAQLKQRLNSLKMIANKVSKAFARQLANAIITSKLNYNIEIWGKTSTSNKKKIDKIEIDAAKIVLGNITIGRTDTWILKQMKWFNVEKSYINAIQNTIYKTINSTDEHYFKYYMLNNRSIRISSQNTFLYNNINRYNNLPKEITLIKKQNIFKKWLKRYHQTQRSTRNRLQFNRRMSK